MFKKILAVVSVLVLLLAIFVAIQPSTYTVTRTSQPIKATPPEVFAQIQDFHNWNRWSPWHQLDPAMKQTYSGPLNGVGSVYHWSSQQSDIGAGRMEIISATAPSDVQIKLDFLEPVNASSNIDFKIAQTASGGAQVTWTMNGNADFMTKIYTAFGMMDRMVGKDFEKGLAQLKAVAEQ